MSNIGFISEIVAKIKQNRDMFPMFVKCEA